MLKGKNIILTGGKRIGQEVATWLFERGANVAMTYLHSRDEARVIEHLAKKRYCKCFSLKTDVTKEEEVGAFVKEAVAYFGIIHGLVYMASLFPKGEILEPTMNDWQQLFSVHVLGIENFVRYLKKHFEERKERAKIIIFSDGAAETGRPYKGFRHYLVTKAAASALVRALAVDLAPHILVNGIAPGPILPPPEYTQKEINEVSKLTLLHRWGGPTEIARGVIYLLEQEFITGQVLVIDGGRYLFSQ